MTLVPESHNLSFFFQFVSIFWENKPFSNILLLWVFKVLWKSHKIIGFEIKIFGTKILSLIFFFNLLNLLFSQIYIIFLTADLPLAVNLSNHFPSSGYTVHYDLAVHDQNITKSKYIYFYTYSVLFIRGMFRVVCSWPRNN